MTIRDRVGLFNFGQAPTSIPGPEPGFGLSFHSYAIDAAGEANVARLGVEAAERDGAPVILTEFGATSDPVVLRRLVGQLDERLLPWMLWAYEKQIVRDQQRPLEPDAIHSQAALDALVRPYPLATAGIPTRIAFDPELRTLELAYATGRAGGGAFARRLDTLVLVPRRQYPDGYTVAVTGARVRSKPAFSVIASPRPEPWMAPTFAPRWKGSKRCA